MSAGGGAMEVTTRVKVTAGGVATAPPSAAI
jgi:hypothetical protein